MNEFKIEKNIPISEMYDVKKPNKYPFGEMQVGDSILISKIYTRKIHSDASNAARNYKDKSPGKSEWKFATRKVKLTRGWGIRVWRIK